MVSTVRLFGSAAVVLASMVVQPNKAEGSTPSAGDEAAAVMPAPAAIKVRSVPVKKITVPRRTVPASVEPPTAPAGKNSGTIQPWETCVQILSGIVKADSLTGDSIGAPIPTEPMLVKEYKCGDTGPEVSKGGAWLLVIFCGFDYFQI